MDARTVFPEFCKCGSKLRWISALVGICEKDKTHRWLLNKRDMRGISAFWEPATADLIAEILRLEKQRDEALKDRDYWRKSASGTAA